MYRIIAGRGTGKTYKLMSMASETKNSVLVCSNPYAMKQKAVAYGFTGFDIVSYKEFFEQKYSDKKYFIDELELFVKHFGNDLSGYTISIED